MPALKLNRPDPKVRLSLNIPSSLNELLKQYAEYHKSTTGEDATVQAISEAILRHHLESDKAFNKYLQNLQKPTAKSQPAPGAPFIAQSALS